MSTCIERGFHLTYSKEEEQTIEEGLELFCKHFRNLWD